MMIDDCEAPLMVNDSVRQVACKLAIPLLKGGYLNPLGPLTGSRRDPAHSVAE